MWARRLAYLLVTAALTLPALSFAQTETPTVTNTRTSTPTATPTIANVVGVMAYRETCGSPPCTLGNVIPGRGRQDAASGGGHKTVAVSTGAGTATTLVFCRTSTDPHAPAVQLAALSGATCTTAANCKIEFDTWCDELWLQISACSSCQVSGFFRQDFH